MSGSLRVREHTLNLINALTNLSPSRNIISQLILLLPEDPATIERSYPETTSLDARGVLESLGVKFSEKVERTQKSFAEALYEHIHKLFDWLDDELLSTEWKAFERYGTIEMLGKMDAVRSSLAKLTGTHIDSIPNPYREWAMLVLKKLSTLYGRDKVFRFLKIILDGGLSGRHRNYKDKALEQLFNKLKAEIVASPPELKELQRSIMLVEDKSECIYSKGSSRRPQGDICIEHSKYHLDPLICESYWIEAYPGWEVDYEFRIRHKESLSEALREAYT